MGNPNPRSNREPKPINLKVLLPFKIFIDTKGVKRIVARTLRGPWAPSAPTRLRGGPGAGDSTYETEADGEVYVAVDQGVLVKAGNDVLISVGNAIGGTDLDKLHEAVKQEFLDLDEQEKSVRRCWRRWRADSSAVSWSFNMDEMHKAAAANDETVFSQQVGGRQPASWGEASWSNERLVRPGHVGARRLDGGHSDRGRRGPRYLGRHPLSEFLFMGTHASFSWTGPGLSQCLALGPFGIPGNAGGHE